MIARFEKDGCRLGMISDVFAFWAAFALVHSRWLFLGKPLAPFHTPAGYPFPLGLLAGVTVLWCMSLWLGERHPFPLKFRQEFFALLRGGIICSLIALALSPGGWPEISRNAFLILVSAAVLIASSFRALVVPALLRLAGYRTAMRLLIIGDGATADHVERTFRLRKGYKLRRWKPANASEHASSNGPPSGSIKSVLNEYGPHEAI